LNRNLYLEASGKIYRNAGAMTHGVTDEPPDGMSLEKMDAIREALQYEREEWLPARRVSIPKKNGKNRPLGMPVWSDKLVQEVRRTLLNAYYEPQFSEHAHGFRPERGCHTALREIYHKWIGTTGFIEGEIKGWYDNLDHELLLKTLEEKIHDGLITLSWYHRQRGTIEQAEEWRNQAQALPSVKTNDPDYRRLNSVRYADEMLLGFVGPRSEAEEIKQQLGEFLREELKLELSEEKTLITHARSGAARLLGYEVTTLQDNAKRTKKNTHHPGTETMCRSGNSRIGLRVPKDILEAKGQRYLKGKKALHRAELINDSDSAIVTTYQLEYRGIAN
jgi:hypothetical protein